MNVNIQNQYDLASGIGFFLQSKGEKVYGKWSGRIPAAVQRQYFGAFLGKGTIYVDGQEESIEMWTKVCFGTDIDVTIRLDAKNPKASFVNDQGKSEVLRLVDLLKGNASAQ